MPIMSTFSLFLPRTNVSECQSWVCKRLATSNHQQLELIHFINAKLHFNASKGNGNYVDNDGRCNKPDLTTPNGTNSTGMFLSRIICNHRSIVDRSRRIEFKFNC